jgi:hypothetical protein
MAASGKRRSGNVKGQRAAGAWGLGFVILLLIGAGMASVPGADETTDAVRAFYEKHAGVVVVAQLVELVATVPLLMFVIGLARSTLVARVRPLLTAGVAMTSAAVLTVVPPLWLCVVASTGSAGLVDNLALLSDLVDVLLFLTIAWFAAAWARDRLGPRWLRWVAVATAGLCGLRAVEIALSGELLTVIAPVTFVLLVVALSLLLLRQAPRTDPHGP